MAGKKTTHTGYKYLKILFYKIGKYEIWFGVQNF